MGRPRILTDEQRKRANAVRCKRWREKHPHSWDRIWRKAYARRKAAKALGGMELDMSGLEKEC